LIFDYSNMRSVGETTIIDAYDEVATG